MIKLKEFEIIGKRGQVIRLSDKLFPLYIVKGDKNFLIDSGAAAMAGVFHERITNALKQFGVSGSNRIDTLLLTHTHWDHTGAAYYLQQIYGFNVLASQRGVQLLQNRKVVGIIDRLNQEYKKMVKDTSDTRFGHLEKLEAVGQGDTIPVDAGSYFEVIETPGHTRCSVSYLLHPDRILFQGDTAGLLELDGSIKPIFLSNYTRYENSIKKQMDIEVEALAFPHNRVIKGRDRVKKYLQDSLARTQEMKGIIRESLKKEKDIDKVAEDLYHREFSKSSFMGPKEAILINIKAMIKNVVKEFPQE